VSKRPRISKKPRPKAAAATDSDTPRRRLRLALETLEVTRGHDGFLRGKPEPVVLVAMYRTNGSLPATLVGRSLVRVRLTRDMPCSVELGVRELSYDARFAATERIVVLAFALEENGGQGVATLYAAFETPERLLIYDATEPVPSPNTLNEWADCQCRAPSARAIEVLLSGAPVEQSTGSDQFISACAFSVKSQDRADESWRMPFVARDARNDWTLLMTMRVGL